MIDNLIVLLSYYNRINNFSYNIDLCKKYGIKTATCLDFPKHDNNFITNFSNYKKALKKSQSCFKENTFTSKKNIGKTIYPFSICCKLNKQFKYVAVIEDDFLITKSFLDFIQTIIKNENNIYMILGVNGFDKGNKGLYCKTLINIPLCTAVYNVEYVINALKDDIDLCMSYFPNILEGKDKLELYKNIERVWFPEKRTYFLEDSKIQINGNLLDIKLFLYNLKNNIHTYVPKITLTPYNQEDTFYKIPLLTNYLNFIDINFKKLEYFNEDDILRFKKIIPFLTKENYDKLLSS